MRHRKIFQYKWVRRLFPEDTWYKTEEGLWYDYKDYINGVKIIDIEGFWYSQLYCSCGNELTHSNSYIEGGANVETEFIVYKYKCINCKKITYANPEIMPGLMVCDERGVPLE